MTGEQNNEERFIKLKEKSTPSEKLFELMLLSCASLSVLAVVIITIYLFYRGAPIIYKVGVNNFVFNTEWSPLSSPPSFGILPMIVASFTATICAVAFGVVIGIMTAVYLAELAPRRLARILRPAIDLLAGIPSVVYGFWGLAVIIPLIRKVFGDENPGNSLLAVIIILSIMILPTIINLSETSLRAVPISYKEGSLALGSTQLQAVFKVQIPAAKSGIIASVVLGIGRALGETMAVVMVAGNAVQMPESFLSMVRTLTGGIVIEMNYSEGLHRDALFGIGVVLFVFIMIINLILNKMLKKKVIN